MTARTVPKRSVLPETKDIAGLLRVACRNGKPGVFVSNVGLDDLARLYDDRIASRLAAGTVFELAGADRRIAPADVSRVRTAGSRDETRDSGG